jgi:hypothetical protein
MHQLTLGSVVKVGDDMSCRLFPPHFHLTLIFFPRAGVFFANLACQHLPGVRVRAVFHGIFSDR